MLVACAMNLLAAVAATATGAGPLDYTVPPLRASQYSAYERHSEFAPMADGVRLALTCYLPVGVEGAKIPTLLWYLPGHRESIRPDTGEIVPAMNPSDVAFFTSYGYAVVVAEMRGSGASFGSREIDRGPQIGRDGKDLVDWLASRIWSDGHVGMIGLSYQGFSQFATAAQRPHALRAIFPEIAGFDDYSSMFNPGGIFVEALSKFAAANIARDDRNEFSPDGPMPKLPSVPVTDENGDGHLEDEIPLDLNLLGSDGRPKTPRYSTPGARQDLYYQATLAHLKNLNLTVDHLKQAPYRDSKLAGSAFSYGDLDPGVKPQAIARSGIAVYSRGGWFDYHARDTVMWFSTLRGHTPVRLMMAPTGHSALPSPRQLQQGDHMTPPMGGPYFAYFKDSSSNDLMNAEKLRFFDRYVREEHNGFDKELPVLIYVMGKGWRREAEWPLERARPVRYGLSTDHQLVEGPPVAGVDEYRADMHTSSLSNGANRWNYGIARTSSPLSLDRDSVHPRLTYTTAELPSDREVTGHPQLEIELSSSADDGDVFAYLEDVAPDGSSLLVTEGELRANYYRRVPLQRILQSEAPPITVKPDLPWHGFSHADYSPMPFAGRHGVRLSLDFMPTSWLFRKGHRIRLALAAADWPSFALHPALSPRNDPDSPDTIRPVWQVRRGPGISALILPWVP